MPTPPGSQRPQGRGWPGAVDGSRGATSFPGDTGTPGSGRGWTRRRPPGGGPERVRAGRSSSRLWGPGVRPSTHPPLTNTLCLASLTERRLHKGKGRLGYGHTARAPDQPPACTLEGPPLERPRPRGPRPSEGPTPWRTLPLEAPFPWRSRPLEGSPGKRGCLKGHLTWKPRLVENCQEAEGQGLAMCAATGGPPSRPPRTGHKPPPPTVGPGTVRRAARCLDPGARQGKGRHVAVGPLSGWARGRLWSGPLTFRQSWGCVSTSGYCT